jgi:hypothetical protein
MSNRQHLLLLRGDQDIVSGTHDVQIHYKVLHVHDAFFDTIEHQVFFDASEEKEP